MYTWFSVEDFTPLSCYGKPSNRVIALCDCGIVYRMSYTGTKDDGLWNKTESFTNNASKRVTHWMPLLLP